MIIILASVEYDDYVPGSVDLDVQTNKTVRSLLKWSKLVYVYTLIRAIRISISRRRLEIVVQEIL